MTPPPRPDLPIQPECCDENATTSRSKSSRIAWSLQPGLEPHAPICGRRPPAGKCQYPRDQPKPRIGGISSNATARHRANKSRQQEPAAPTNSISKSVASKSILTSLDLPAHQPIVSARRTEFDDTNRQWDKVRRHAGHTSMTKDTDPRHPASRRSRTVIPARSCSPSQTARSQRAYERGWIMGPDRSAADRCHAS